jgi:hypothetical protein
VRSARSILKGALVQTKRIANSERGLTALQRHVAYFDPDGTGVITLGATYRGIRDLQVLWPLALFLTGIIHLALAPLLGFNLRLHLPIARIDRGIHPGDSGIFRGDGELSRAKFDELFVFAVGAERARDPNAMLTQADLYRFMLRDEPVSLPAYFSWAESRLLLGVARNERRGVNGEFVDVVSRRRLEQFYEGRLLSAIARYWRVERARDEKQAARNVRTRSRS